MAVENGSSIGIWLSRTIFVGYWFEGRFAEIAVWRKQSTRVLVTWMVPATKYQQLSTRN